MLLCSHQQKLEGNDIHSSQEVDWTAAGRQYSNLNEMPSFIAQQRQQDSHSSAHKVEVDPSKLQGKQLEAYNIVKCHYFSHQQQRTSLKMIVSGTAGTGKSYLIWCLQKLLGDHVRVTAPTGVAAYNVHGHTLHSLLSIPVRETWKGNVSTHSRNLLLESDTSYWMRCQWWAGNCLVKWREDCVQHFLTSK